MRRFPIFIVLLLNTLFISCKKENNGNADCNSNASTIREITDQQATVILDGGKFFIIEKGTIDTRLIPCNLEKDFQMPNLQVTISGDVKATTKPVNGPCCTENFVINKIAKR